MPREIITVNVGGAGLNIGQAVCQQYMADHGIKADGSRDGDSDDTLFTTFFDQGLRSHTLRQVSVDLDPSAVDRLRKGPLGGGILHPQFLISGQQDASCNFAKGHYTLGKDVLDQVNDRLRKSVDACDNVQGFVVNHSLGGGTGSGLGALILERLSVDFGKKTKMGCEVLAGDISGKRRPCETYNESLAMHSLLDHTEVSLVFENRQLGNIVKGEQFNITTPNYGHVNSLIAKICSGATSGMRFDAVGMNVDLDEFQTNLVPFPRLHFMTSSFVDGGGSTVRENTSGAFLSTNLSLGFPTFDVVEDKYMAITLNYHGSVKSQEAQTTVSWIEDQGKVSFAEACPTKCKVGLAKQTIQDVDCDSLNKSEKSDKQVTMIGNQTAVTRVFARNNKRFDAMYSQRAYVHHYVGQGMEEGVLIDAREDIGFLEKDYADALGQDADDNQDEDDDFR